MNKTYQLMTHIRIVLTFFASIFFVSCSDDESDMTNIISDYIIFSHHYDSVPINPCKLSSHELNDKNSILFEHDVFLQDLSFTTEFEPATDEPLIIEAGKTDGFIRIEGATINLYKFHSSNGIKLNECINLITPLAKGIRYKIGFHKTLYGVKFFLKGENLDFERWYDIDEDFMQNRLSGNPFFTIESGSVTVYKSVLSSDYKENAKVMVIGDSFIEGMASIQYGYPINSRWCAQLAEAITPNNCIIDGRGGEVVCDQWFKRLELECSWFSPEYTIISMGTNNYSRVDEYKIYMRQAIDLLKTKGIKPILVTVTPRYEIADSPSPSEINEWIKNSGELYIDINKAIINPENPSKWKNGFILPDGIHPTVEGYKAMFERLKEDCPFLF